MEQRWQNTWPLLDVAHLQFPRDVAVNDRFVIREWGNRPAESIHVTSEELCIHKHFENNWLIAIEESLQNHMQPATTWHRHTPTRMVHGTTTWRLVEVALDMYEINPELWKVTETWTTASAPERPHLVVIS